METVANTVARYSSRELQHVRRVLEGELITACNRAVLGTQAHVGALELLSAVGAELDRRGHSLTFPAWVDVCHEDGVRGPTVRVF